MMADAISGKLLTTDNIMPTHRPFLHSLDQTKTFARLPWNVCCYKELPWALSWLYRFTIGRFTNVSRPIAPQREMAGLEPAARGPVGRQAAAR
jgi:hypothetical protein